MHLMNEFFAKLSQDAGVTEFSIVSDDALIPRSSARLRMASQPNKSPTKTKKDGKQQKFVAPTNHKEDRAPLPPRKWESNFLSVDEDEQLLEPASASASANDSCSQSLDDASSTEEMMIQCTTRPGFETTLTNPSAGNIPVVIRPPTLPRRKESIDETAALDDATTCNPPDAITDRRFKDLSTSSLGLRLAAVQLDRP